MALNYYAINKVLGGKMVPGRRARFGGFGRIATRAEVECHRPRPEPKVELSRAEERVLVAAFEAVREGHAPDRLLWDTAFADRFHRKARAMGVHAPAKVLTRRIIGIRKDSTRYRKYGIVIQPATVIEPRASVIPRYAHAVEFALVRLRYRYGASIDDILMDPVLGSEYVELTSEMTSGLSEDELRLGALYIRKSRYLAKQDRTLFDQMDRHEIESAFQEVGTFDGLDLAAIPAGTGLLAISEPKRPLYVARNADVRAAIKEMVRGSALATMANQFWQPDPRSLIVHVLPGDSFAHTGIRRWQLKLIAELRPVFNWPVLQAA